MSKYKIADLVQHYKTGNKYVIKATDVEHTETGEKFIIYQGCGMSDKVWARPQVMFEEEVDGKPRFKYICSWEMFDGGTVRMDNEVTGNYVPTEELEPIPENVGIIVERPNEYVEYDDYAEALADKCIRGQFDIEELSAIKPAHYKQGKIDLLEGFDLLFPQNEFRAIMKSIAIRYLFRFDKKNGIEDLRKAIECIERLIEFEKAGDCDD